MSTRKLTVLNMGSSMLLQVVTILSGLIVPRLILNTFGSSINGLVSSITQFLNYIALVEGGLGSVVLAALYKGIAAKDIVKVSAIAKASQKFFRQIGFIYAVYVVAFAFIYPAFIRGGLGYTEVCLLVYVIAISTFIQYMFSATSKLVLVAYKYGFVTYLTQILIILINLLGVVVVISFFPSIHLVKLVHAIAFLAQPIVFNRYVNKKIGLIKNVEPDNEALSQRWSGFGQNLAFFIHENTDVIVLTVFSTLETVSVYSVYLLIIKAVRSLVISLSSAFSPTIGHVLAQNDVRRSNRVFDVYELGMWFISTIGFGACIVLIVPFVGIYTRGVTDTDYIKPAFAILMSLAEMVYCLRDPYNSVVYNSGHFKQTAKYAYTEAVLNIAISIVLVFNFGLIGVAIGTLVSMVFRTIAYAFYLKDNILKRPLKTFTKKLVLFATISLIEIVILNNIVPQNLASLYAWIMYGALTLFLITAVHSVFMFVFFRADFMGFVKQAKKRGN